MTTMTQTTRGFAAPCIKCGEPAVQVSLSDVSEFSCSECNETFTRDEVDAILKHWGKVLAWLDMGPPADD